jgi:hypothetical protein
MHVTFLSTGGTGFFHKRYWSAMSTVLLVTPFSSFDDLDENCFVVEEVVDDDDEEEEEDDKKVSRANDETDLTLLVHHQK